MANSRRRLGACVAAFAVVASLSTLSAPAQAASPSSALNEGTSWLTNQLTSGLVHNNQYDFDDYGLSADIALALAASADTAGAKRVADAIAPGAADNWYAAYGSTYAGSVAKAAVLAKTAGDDPTDYGGANLITLLESLVSTDAPIAGRIHDQASGADYANVIGQAYAVRALEQAGSADAPDALNFLLEQQCAAGYFRLNFTSAKTAADQTCDGGRASGASPADPDTTSTVILQLQSLADTNPTVATALKHAADWLLAQQHKDGSFNGGTSTASPNANSTGLAGWALGTAGDTAAARAAAIWVRQHQVQPISLCPTKLGGDAGAIGYDTATLSTAAKTGITVAAQDQWRRASSQAVPALRWLPAMASSLKLTAPTAYTRAGTVAVVKVAGVAAGNSVCAALRSVRQLTTASSTGVVSVGLRLPAGTANRKITVADGTTTRTATVKVLGTKTFKVKAPARVKRGKKATVKVTGLAPRERYVVRLGSKIVKKGYASASGTVQLRVKVGKKLRKVKIKVTGQFPSIRSGAKTVRVTR